MSCIYALNFPNGKRYIGMTSMLLSKRMAIHRMALKRQCSSALYRAWRKHGDPKVETLAVVEKHMLRDTERKAIAVFGTMVPNGYNLVAGGEGGGVSAESRRKMSLARKGKRKSEEHRRRIGLGQLGRSGTWTGKTQSPEHVEKRAQAHRGVKRSPEFRVRMSALAKVRIRSPESNKKRSETMKAVRANRFWSTKPSLGE
jgi:group I intron endonuclease